MVQFSHPRMTTGKTIALTVWAFVEKVMFLLFNTLVRFVIEKYKIILSFFSIYNFKIKLSENTMLLDTFILFICMID